jgi:ubiquinone/menaquinone biosynthesis C-methylase UbiE
MKDNFSSQAETYSKYRPTYPHELFDFILSNTGYKGNAWDCGTGNGQTAKELSRYFENVFATDISEKQIEKGCKSENIFYSIQPAEKTSFADNIFDLVTVSQALHWFDPDKFYSEVKRTAKPGGWIAVWTYTLPSISPPIDELIHTKFYKEILGEYWDAERKLVDEKYGTISFPFREIECPLFEIKFGWTQKELEGYLNSWSAVQKFILANRINPVDNVMNQVKIFWKEERMKVVFPVYMRMGQVEK